MGEYRTTNPYPYLESILIGGQTEFELNHAISYAHYVASLPAHSPYFAQTLPRLKQLLRDLLAQADPQPNHSAASPGGSSSSYSGQSAGAVGTIAQARLAESICKALLWAGWAGDGLAHEVAEVFEDLMARLEGMMGGSTGSSKAHPA